MINIILKIYKHTIINLYHNLLLYIIYINYFIYVIYHTNKKNFDSSLWKLWEILPGVKSPLKNPRHRRDRREVVVLNSQPSYDFSKRDWQEIELYTRFGAWLVRVGESKTSRRRCRHRRRRRGRRRDVIHPRMLSSRNLRCPSFGLWHVPHVRTARVRVFLNCVVCTARLRHAR